MALVQVLGTDSLGVTSYIDFNNPGQVDQVSFGGNAITFAACSQFNLSKSDTVLYIKYLEAFSANLLINFPAIAGFINTSWPICNFQTSITSAGVTHINYIQSSGASTVLDINYVPIAASSGFSARVSPVVITLQEFFMMCYILSQYAVQVELN